MIEKRRETMASGMSTFSAQGMIQINNLVDFKTVVRILELTEKRCNSVVQKSQGSRTSAIDLKRMIHEPSSEFEGADGAAKIVDKLSLLQAYETTLRNQGKFWMLTLIGVLPAEDLRVYQLLTEVIEAAEIESHPEYNNNQKIEKLKGQLNTIFNQVSSSNFHSVPISPSYNSMKDVGRLEKEDFGSRNVLTQRTHIVQDFHHIRMPSSHNSSLIPTPGGDLSLVFKTKDSSFQHEKDRQLLKKESSLEKELKMLRIGDENKSANEITRVKSINCPAPYEKVTDYYDTCFVGKTDSSPYVNTESNRLANIGSFSKTDLDSSAAQIAPKSPVRSEQDVDRLYKTANQQQNRLSADQESFRKQSHQTKKQEACKPLDRIDSYKPGEFFPFAKQTLRAVRRQSNSRLNLTANVEQSVSKQSNMFQEEPQLSRMPVSKTSFLTVLKVFRAWQLFVRRRKEQTKLQKQMLNLVVKAISKHENSLLLKSMRGLRLLKIRRARQAIIHSQVQARHRKAMLRFYLQAIVNARLSHQLSRNLSFIATQHCHKALGQAVVQAWRLVAKQQKKLERRLTSSFKRNPRNLFVLLVWIGSHWLNGSFDIFEFYCYCTSQDKVKPSKRSKFTRIVQFGIKARLGFLFNSWKNKIKAIKAIGVRQNERLLKQTFKGLKDFAFLKQRLRFLVVRRRIGLQRVVIASLIMNQLASSHLSKRRIQVQKAHSQATKKLCFNLWLVLLKSYRGQIEQPKALQSVLLYKRKAWNMLVVACNHSKTIRNFRKRQLSLKGLRAFYKLKQQNELIAHLQTKTRSRHDCFVRKRFFKAMVRGCLIRQRARTYRMFILLTRGMKSLQSAVLYRQLINNLQLIALQQYSRTLQKTSLQGLMLNRITRRKRAISVLKGLANKKQTLMRLAFRSLKLCAKSHAVSKAKKVRVGSSFRMQLLRKCLFKLRVFSQKSIYMKQASDQVQLKVQLRLMRMVVCRFMQTGDRKLRLKQLEAKLASLHRQRTIFKHFGQWQNKHLDLTAKFDAIHMRHCHVQRVVAFDAWMFLARQSIADQKLISRLHSKWIPRRKRLVFKGLQTYAKKRVQSKQMKMFGQFYLIRKILVRTLQSWRQTIKADAFAKATGALKLQQTLSDCFLAWKKVFYCKQMSLNVLKSKKITLCQQIMTFWNRFAFVSRRNKDIVSFFGERRQARIKLLAFRSIRVAQTRDLFLQKTFRLRSLFDSWSLYVERNRDINRKGAQIMFVNRQLCKHLFLKQWRQTLFLSLAINKVAVPFYNALKLKSVLKAWRSNTSQAKKIKSFHRLHLLQKGIASLYRHSKVSVRLQFILRQKQTRIQNEVLFAMRMHANIQRRLKVAQSELTSKVKSHIKQRCLSHWAQLTQEQLEFVPLESKIESSVRIKWLFRICFASLKRFVSIRQGKKQMFASLDQYYSELVLERAFKQLLHYREFKQLQRVRQQQADRFYRRKVLHKWTSALSLKADKPLQLARAFYQLAIQRRAFRQWQSGVKVLRAEYVLKDQAALFSVIRLKLKVLRSLSLAKSKEEQIKPQEICLNLRNKTSGLLYVAVNRRCLNKRMLQHLRFVKYMRNIRIRLGKRPIKISTKSIKKKHQKRLRRGTIGRLCMLFANKKGQYKWESERHFNTEQPRLRRSLSAYASESQHSNSEPEIVNEEGLYILGQSGLLLHGGLDNSIIQAERMLAENSFHEAADQGIFIVERMASEEPMDSSNSSGDYEAAGVKIENLVDDYADSRITVHLQPGLHKEDSTQDLFELVGQKVFESKSVKSKHVIANIRSNLQYLNLDD